jgi:glutamine amidotransferase
MCRWLAYSGPAIYLEDVIFKPENSLIRQSRDAQMSVRPTNGDGFGLGWYGEREEPGLYHEVRPAWSDENLRHLCRHIRSGLFFAHVRSSTGTPTTRPNCHPFAHGRWLFMHNGSVGNWTRIRRQIEALIPDEYYPARVGTTDSEAMFLAMLGAGIERDPIGATARTLAAIEALAQEGAAPEPIRFTSALSDGKTLYAFRYASADTAANSLYYGDFGGHVVVVSEPLDREQEFWKKVPEGHYLIAAEGKPVSVHPFSLAPRVVAAE